MQSPASRCVLLLLAAVLLAPAPAGAQFIFSDDRGLLARQGAPPNVLLILDSGATMVHDPETNAGEFLLSGDDPQSKLYQAKDLLDALIAEISWVNLGFTFYEKTSISVEYLNYVYRVRAGQGALLDGTAEGGLLRMGSSTDVHNNASQAKEPYAAFPIRYGLDGDQQFILHLGDYDPANPPNGAQRVVSYLLDAAGSAKVAGQPPYYYPAYNWGTDGVSDGLSWGHWVRLALEGEVSWEDVAAHNGIDTTAADWKEILKAYVLEDITKAGDPWGQPLGTLTDSNQIGSEVLLVKEEYQVWRNDNRTWVTLDEKTTEVEYVDHFLLYDHKLDQGTAIGDSLHASTWQGSADCNGYLDLAGTAKAPVVPIPTPDPIEGTVADSSADIRPFFGPQTQPVFYFPNGPRRFLPAVREHFIPRTESIIAAGRRPIKDTLNEIEYYYNNDVFNRVDPYADCRSNFALIITDGVETCSNTTAPCVAARGLGADGIPVYVVGFGPPEQVDTNVLQCVADESGGIFYSASNQDELIRALRDIFMDIERRVRGFSSLVVPSVQSDQDQTAFIATFIPENGRSIWDGHLYSFEVDPATGMVPLTPEGTPDVGEALWDAGAVLAATAAADRRMYYGGDSGAGLAVPTTRYPFTYTSGDATSTERLRTLVNPALTDAEVETTVQFIRGDRPADPYAGAKLGDIFHSRPLPTGPPSCFGCALHDLNGYKSQFRAEHRKRRKVLFVGADDGALHAFDSGFWDDSSQMFDNGTGTELFAWLPRGSMDKLDDLALTTDHQWTVDGTPTLADVWVDHQIAAGSSPVAADREWRTLLLAGLRRGGHSYLVLDVTQPDPYDADGIPQPGANRVPGCLAGGAGCSGSWPELRFEFTDTSDEDGNYEPDLGQTWSRPLVGFVDVQVGDAVEQRSVAVFGGGYVPGGDAGNFLYIVDLETGDILLKENVVGMVPGQVSAVDLDLDGFLERLYWGTTDGTLWRMDLPPVLTLDADGRISNVSPYILFDAGIYQPFFVQPKLVPVTFDADGSPLFAVVIGTGDRSSIFSHSPIPHRLYVILDTSDGVTLTDDDLQPIQIDSAAAGSGTNYVTGTDTARGWYLVLGDGEKVNTPALIFDQKVIFSTFSPAEEIVVDPDGLCALVGSAATYTMWLLNGDPISDSRKYTHDDDALMATDSIQYMAGDGKIHTTVTTTKTKIYEPIAAQRVPIRVYSWKEE